MWMEDLGTSLDAGRQFSPIPSLIRRSQAGILLLRVWFARRAYTTACTASYDGIPGWITEFKVETRRNGSGMLPTVSVTSHWLSSRRIE